MPRKPLTPITRPNGGANLGFEEQLWRAADALRGHIEPAEYKHIVLTILFLKYISDNANTTESESPSIESADDHSTPFTVPRSASWEALRNAAQHGNAGRAVAAAMHDIENANESLKGLLVVNLTRVDDARMGRLIELVSAVSLVERGSTSRDVLGRVYEYFLAKFASTEGRSGGEYYTPHSVVELLVELLQPYSGSVYDPCCGTAGMFVQSQRFLTAHGGRASDVRVFGQESSPTTWRLAKMNLAIRGIEADLGKKNADSFLNDLHPSLKADFILANPPFNAKDWGADRLQDDARWAYGMPPSGNANYAWIQHILSHLAPNGVAGFVLSNGSLASDQAGERELRRRLIEADVVECVISLPTQLFYGTQIPVSIWVVSPTKTRFSAKRLRGQTLFIDGRKLGFLVDRVHAELREQDIQLLASTFHEWRQGDTGFVDMPGFAKSASEADIRAHRFALVPGRYVGFAEDRFPEIDSDFLASEIDEIRDLLADIEKASAGVLNVLDALARG